MADDFKENLLPIVPGTRNHASWNITVIKINTGIKCESILSLVGLW